MSETESEIVDREVKRISTLREISLEWKCEDRLQVVHSIALEMKDNDLCKLTDRMERLLILTGKSAEFINKNQAFVVAGYGKLIE